MDLGELIKRDHDEYRRFFAKMAKTTPQDGQMRRKALKEIMRRIYAHHEAEELTIFPKMMQVPELRGMAFELEVEHADMKMLFEALLKDSVDTEVWKYKLSSIYDIMHAHWLKEEEDLTPFALDFFSKADWEAFGKRFNEIMNEKLNER
ncbi:MAG: hemerythrin domain-containing protein [Candidatus Bathyarchaeota archaeon]|nr:hemerythrin domain-containing protein [Candidatus Bathyarchaeota archaeon]